ncbi:exonuclease mut-7 homolog [Galleria mellonella]|uniref:Exonuclease mut-7 homolog n=1 Tax=Galleria mellonella TaxID=7137 RepID=A0A6J1WPT4_GALME|nr:exonuclease mut-7 homolog [Galleria mellonella]
MNKMDLNELVSKNQSIKIVPSVEDSLRNIGLNVDLDENSSIWFKQLKTAWRTWKKSPTIENSIEIFFQSVLDPYRVALVFVIKCEECKDCKPKSLPFYIVETLQKWSVTSRSLPEESVKLPAFHIAIQQRNQHFLNLVVKTYQISAIKETILPIVKDMIQNDNCKQASQIVMAMELFEDIPVENLLFPLILQDKTSMIDEYLSECPNQVQPLLVFLDKLLDKNFRTRDFVQKYIEDNKICHVKYDKIHYKPLGKLVARLCNKFNIPIETCKNLSKNRTTGGLKYLIHQKYQEHNVSSSVWEDLVKDSLNQNADSALEFIDMLVDYDRNEALKWASYLNIAKNKLPLALRNMSLQEAPEENWETDLNVPHDYYKFSLLPEQIVIIDTGEKFYDLMVSTLATCNVVSIDCEWKPSFGATQSQVALVQVATHNNVYLIDALLLNKQQYISFWYTFNKSFLDNAEIVKLGFGLEQDLKEIKASVNGLGNIKVKGEGLLDLGLLWRSLLNNGLILPGNSDNGGNSLSSLVQSCFGLPLEKSEQCSNWELRPLRDTQILYAALDAYVLVEIYEFLQNLCQKQGINFDEICNDVMLERKKKTSKKTKVIERIQSYVHNIQTKSVQDVKLLVDFSLSNLMPYLRYCGIDTVAMEPTMLWCDTIKLAISEDRLILIVKLKCSPTLNFPQSSILDVGKGSVKEHLQKVLTNFNICIMQNNLLTFCMKCNSKDLKKLDSTEVLHLCDSYKATTNTETPVTRYVTDDYDDEEANYDNFLSDSDYDDDIYQIQPVKQTHQSNCKTSKGVPIEINDVQKLSETNKPVFVCEDCGNLYWEGDELLKSVSDTVYKLINLTIW